MKKKKKFLPEIIINKKKYYIIDKYMYCKSDEYIGEGAQG